MKPGMLLRKLYDCSFGEEFSSIEETIVEDYEFALDSSVHYNKDNRNPEAALFNYFRHKFEVYHNTAKIESDAVLRKRFEKKSEKAREMLDSISI